MDTRQNVAYFVTVINEAMIGRKVIKMLYAIITDKATSISTLLAFTNYSEMVKSTFPPDSITTWIIDTSRPPRGSSYTAKKSRLQEELNGFNAQAADIANRIPESVLTDIKAYFVKHANRYGLKRELQRLEIFQGGAI